ncbi:MULTISPECIES: invasion associated locus B family protein [unclassified Roseitalea]|uniref:invasion associated locus B family protein n=1 Tax=unclassified Roseitalea TaxID=2639107 RepID=UPI00273E1926|nr:MULTISPECIES: invasion associated locus B family protein [unclassified Roseitalea]
MLDGKPFVATLLAPVILAFTVAMAAAQTPQRIGQFNDWGAISYQSSNGKVCYVVSLPLTKEPANLNHGENFFLVTQRGNQNVTYEPQFIAGYPLQENSQVKVTVDGKPFTFFSKENTAWTENAAQDSILVDAMKAGARMVVEATSGRGNQTTYEYSLSGVTAALNAIESCD